MNLYLLIQLRYSMQNMQQTLLQNMQTAQLQQSRAQSLKNDIFQSIKNTKFESVPNLLKKTRRRDYSYSNISPHRSPNRPSVDSLQLQATTSGVRHSFSPLGLISCKCSAQAHRSVDSFHSRQQVLVRRMPTITVISTRPIKDNIHLSNPKRSQSPHPAKKSPKRRRKHLKSQNNIKTNSRKSKQHNSKEKSRSRLNLSSILEQESSEQPMTPSSKGEKTNKHQRRNYSGDKTKKKQRGGLKDVVWHRLQRCLRQPEKRHRLLKTDYLSIKFRVLRKTLLQIQVQIMKQIQSLSITLHKGSIECQSIQEHFSKLQPNTMFNLYSSVRMVDLNQPLRLPKLLIQAILSQEEKIEKVLTLPFCWLHVVENSNYRQTNRSRIKTKVCLEDMACTKVSLKGLMGVIPDWRSQSIGRGMWMWESRWNLGQSEFQLRIVDQEGRFTAELSGRGENRLLNMLQFIEQLLQ